MRALIRTEEIDQAVAQVPPVSSVLQRLLSVLNDPHCDVDDIARLVRSETALAARVLRIANSAFFAFPEPVASVREAIQRLGVMEVHAMVAALASRQLFMMPLSSYGLTAEGLWSHALATAVAGETVALNGDADRGSAYLAGILHPVGLLALDRLAKARDVPAIGEDESMLEWEMKHFGVNNDRIAAEVLRRWRLPEGLAAAVACRYAPDRAESEARLAHVLHTASCLAVDMGAGLEPEKGVFKPNPDRIAAAGITWDAYGEVSVEASQRLVRAKVLLNIG